MKKLFTLLACLPLIISAQIFVDEDFESLESGIFHDDVDFESLNSIGWGALSTNATQGQFDTSTNAGPEQLMIVESNSKRLEIAGPDATTGVTITVPIMEDGLDNFWLGLDSGNQVLKMSSTINVAASDSYNVPVIGLFDSTGYIAGIYFRTSTNTVFGVAFLENSEGTQAAFLINLAEGGLPFERDTDYNFDMYFDKTTGVVSWVCEELEVQGSIESLKVGVNPVMMRYIMLNGSTPDIPNTAAGTYQLDNVLVEAVETAGLSTSNLQVAGLLSTSIYPNPAKEALHVALSANFDAAKTTVSFTNVSGKNVKSVNYSETINIDQLTPGVYFITISDGKNVESHKLIKK